MRTKCTPQSSVTLLLLPLQAALISAVSLSDFKPALTDLRGICKQAYDTTITGCRTRDFAPAGSSCSNVCIQGLVTINKVVNRDCTGVDVPETSLVGLFLRGQGLQALCNIAVVTATGAEMVPPTITAGDPSTATMSGLLHDTASSPTPAQTYVPPSMDSASEVPQSSTTQPTLAGTSTASPASTTASSLQTAPPASTTMLTTSGSQSATAEPATKTSQGSGANGGGSPFDSFQGAATTARLPYAVLSAMLLVALFFSVP